MALPSRSRLRSETEKLAGADGLEAFAERLRGGGVGGCEGIEFVRGFIEGAGVGEEDREQQVIGGVVAACVFDLRRGFGCGYLEAGFGRGRYRGAEGACADMRGDLPVVDSAAGERLFRSPFYGGDGGAFDDLLEALVEDRDHIFRSTGDGLPTEDRAIIQHGGADWGLDGKAPGFAGGAEEDAAFGDQTIENGSALQAVSGECQLHSGPLVWRDGGLDGSGSDRWGLCDRRFRLAENREAEGEQETRRDRGEGRDAPLGFRPGHGDDFAGRGQLGSELAEILDLAAARRAFGEVLLDRGVRGAVGGGHSLVVIQVLGKVRAQSGGLREGAGQGGEPIAAFGTDGEMAIDGKQIRGFQGSMLEAGDLPFRQMGRLNHMAHLTLKSIVAEYY